MKESMRLFLISDDQLLEMYDCVMDGDLKRCELVLYKVRTDQEIKVDRLLKPGPPKEKGVL